MAMLNNQMVSKFALQLNQGPPSGREIRPCMHNHLVELEAMHSPFIHYKMVSQPPHPEIHRGSFISSYNVCKTMP